MSRKRLSLTWTILTVFTLTAISLMVWQVRSGLEHVVSYQTSRPGEERAWSAMRDFWESPGACTRLLRGNRLGHSLIPVWHSAPRPGSEWQGTGWIVKDVYLLGRQDEAAWMARRQGDAKNTVYVKVSLVPRPKQGIPLSVSYLIHAPSVSRIFALGAELSQSRTIASTDGLVVWSCEAKKNPRQLPGVRISERSIMVY
jgi:hypothetical protein